MVLLTLLGLTALLLRERREDKNTYSGQDEKDDPSDIPPVGSTDGQTSQHITSDPEVLPTEEEPTSPPKFDNDDALYDLVGDASEWSAEVLHALNSEFNVKSINIPQVPVSAVSDCIVDVPQASDNPAVDTVTPQSSQLKDNEETIMDINACSDEISIQLSEGGFETIYSGICLDDGLKEGYSEPLQLKLQHQHSEDKERDGASDNETKSDSEVPEVPVPAHDTPEVLNKVLSGLSLRLKNWWERYTWEILTPAMISSFFFIFIVYLGPKGLMMMMMPCFLIRCFHQIITTGYRVYHCYHMLWFRTLSLYFLLCVSYFFYEEKITDYYFTVEHREESVHMLSKYHHFIYFALNLIGFCMVVLSLVKKVYRLPFCMFVWTHLTMLIVAIHLDLIIQNLFEEIIWFIAPISGIICNNIIGYIFGFILSL